MNVNFETLSQIPVIYQLLLQLNEKIENKVEKRWLSTIETSLYLGYSKDSIDFMVKKGTNLYPDGLDGVKDKTLIREAATEARNIIEANKVKAQQAEKAKEEARKKQSLAEIDRLKKAYADKQAAKIAAERKKQEEQRKLWEQKKLEEQQKLSKLFSPRV